LHKWLSLLRKKEALLRASHAEIIEKSTNESCSVCGWACQPTLLNVSDFRFGVKGVYRIAECVKCGLWQTLPRPSSTELADLYQQHYNFAASKRQTVAYDQIRDLFLHSPAYRLWLWLDGDPSLHGLEGTGRLLDVGCNEGRGLEFYRGRGFSAEGLELNKTAAERARAKGFTVHGVPLEEFPREAVFDIVVMANVLEHTFDPVSTIRAARRVLRPGGSLWLSVPNLKSWARSVFGRRWINWHVPFHLTHFSRQTLVALLDDAQLKVEELRTITPSVWLAQSCIAALTARPERPALVLRSVPAVAPISLLFRFALFLPIALANLKGNGDCLVVRARKTDASSMGSSMAPGGRRA